VTIPFWTNLLIRTFAIQELIRRDGVINNILLWLGVIDEPIQMLNTDFAIGFGMVYVYLPLMVLPIYASMEKLTSAWSRRAMTSMRRAGGCCGGSSSRW
jgi:spermidine/putrescine transport system permease protein